MYIHWASRTNMDSLRYYYLCTDNHARLNELSTCSITFMSIPTIMPRCSSLVLFPETYAKGDVNTMASRRSYRKISLTLPCSFIAFSSMLKIITYPRFVPASQKFPTMFGN
ncbi:hypothetical protein M378DRAFT_173819 [Amanita muscaria Koide BX008]|uniref:Uncharacterized protein n=1 Tax=Amanita muscaria (strain Koide BX008) TaxID=946122 RepID=A0A0C2WF08_AMAMK|nr:hypothetical protein M378DRAFT_173819 [Amanita muscaria Koide BX008]